MAHSSALLPQLSTAHDNRKLSSILASRPGIPTAIALVCMTGVHTLQSNNGCLQMKISRQQTRTESGNLVAIIWPPCPPPPGGDQLVMQHSSSHLGLTNPNSLGCVLCLAGRSGHEQRSLILQCRDQRLPFCLSCCSCEHTPCGVVPRRTACAVKLDYTMSASWAVTPLLLYSPCCEPSLNSRLGPAWQVPRGTDN